jgi:hypothetical protein
MSSSSAESRRTCPSAPCESGATLLGIVDADGSVGYLTPPLQIDDDFVRSAKRGRDPERRFRFAGTCVEGGCKQWTGTRCGVIDRVLAAGVGQDAGDGSAGRAALPRCAIRSTCRWFAQAGADACGACPLVVTDTTVGAQAPSAEVGTT